jgi:photosystem II stability/assembly factor-like uncharacterized protein
MRGKIMKNFICLFTVGFALFYSSVNAQWIRYSGLSGNVVSLFTIPDAKGDTILFAGSRGYGVFESINYNTKLTAANKGLTGGGESFAVADTNFFVASGGVFISNDYGKNWKSTNLKGKDPQALAISGKYVFAGTYISGIYRSPDNGTSWTEVDSGLTDSAKYVVVLFVSDTMLFAGTWGRGAFISTDNGESWKEINNGIVNHVHSFAVTPDGTGGTYLFAGTFFGKGVYRSSDFGTSWEAVDSGLTGKNVRGLAVSPDGTGGTNLFAGTQDGGVFLSTDKGTSF